MSTEIEKEFDLAKSFLETILIVTMEETGLILKDSTAPFKLRNQIRTLKNAKAYCDGNNITTKQISLKLLYPLLEFVGLEEDSILLDKWTMLLINMVDSKQDIQTHIFLDILSQMSLVEFKALEIACGNNREFEREIQGKLNNAKDNKNKLVEENGSKIKELQIRLQDLSIAPDAITELRDVSSALSDLRSKITLAGNEVDRLATILENDRPSEIAEMNYYEISNLIRLGVVKKIEGLHKQQINSGTTTHTTASATITELGSLFITACNVKNYG